MELAPEPNDGWEASHETYRVRAAAAQKKAHARRRRAEHLRRAVFGTMSLSFALLACYIVLSHWLGTTVSSWVVSDKFLYQFLYLVMMAPTVLALNILLERIFVPPPVSLDRAGFLHQISHDDGLALQRAEIFEALTSVEDQGLSPVGDPR